MQFSLFKNKNSYRCYFRKENICYKFQCFSYENSVLYQKKQILKPKPLLTKIIKKKLFINYLNNTNRFLKERIPETHQNALQLIII